MLKRLIPLFFLILSLSVFSQNSNIIVSDFSIKNNSEVIKITTHKKGYYDIIFIDKKDYSTLFSLNLFIGNVINFKHNFKKYPKGEYLFIIKQKNKEVFKIIKEK